MEGEITKIISNITKRVKFNVNNWVHRVNLDHRKFGNYEVVYPQEYTPPQPVPSDILRPPYIFHREEITPGDILIKDKHEIEAIGVSCSLARTVLNSLRRCCRPGMTTEEIDCFAHNLIISNGAYPSPLEYNNYPKSICTSVNNIVVHGIPNNRKLKNGDIISVDLTVYLNGFHGDTCDTFLVGNVDEAGQRLVKGAQEILHAGIKCCGPRVPFEKIAKVITKEADKRGLTVIPSVAGHGIGRFFHELPTVFHSWQEAVLEHEEYVEDSLMLPGMVFTIEPAIGEGTEETELSEDGWTLTTYDKSRAAQFEHTIAITDNGYEILTK